MSAPCLLRPLSASDIPAADGLRLIAGWNQTFADWQRLISHDPDGCFAATVNDQVVGTATTTSYGTDLAWIGMVLVHPEQRRHGIGKALLSHCIADLQRRGIRCIKLDATPLGQPLYEKIGFKAEWNLSRWEAALPAIRETMREGGFNSVLQPVTPKNFAAVAALDHQAFGTQRRRLLEMYVAGSQSVAQFDATGQCEGFGLIRQGSRAAYLGPVIARMDETAARLVVALAGSAPGERIYWDIPDHNLSTVELARQMGFTPQRVLVRMSLGENHCPGQPALVRAIIAPEVG
jgi:GNAT superfamily N-acetyltransferase